MTQRKWTFTEPPLPWYWKHIDAIIFLIVALIALVILIGTGGRVTAQAPEGFVLRGTLMNASPDNTPYFQIGDAVVLMLPEDSALLPGLRALEGKRVVISVFPD